MSYAIDWILFVALGGLFILAAWSAYRVGVEEGWRQAGRWADDYLPIEDRPATRDDDTPRFV